MQFTYTYLKNAYNNDVRLGHLQGFPVYAISKKAIYEGAYDSDSMYIIYDDENLLFRDGKVYGTVSASGNLTECYPRDYRGRGKAESFKEESAKEPEPYKSEVIGDVNLELEVDKMLKSGRGTSIDELLKGFNYGLQP